MTTFVALPTVRGMGRAKSREEPPAVPEFYAQWSVRASDRKRSSADMVVRICVPPNLAIRVQSSTTVQMDVVARQKPEGSAVILDMRAAFV